MTRVFLETVHHTAFRYGGWGVAREIGGVVAASRGASATSRRRAST
ncbi:MAG: hypothetical protein WDN45_01015 [Caulobacteraceae bacterium]